MNTAAATISKPKRMTQDELEHAIEVDPAIAWRVLVVEDEAHRERLAQANAAYWRKYPQMEGDILFAA